MNNYVQKTINVCVQPMKNTFVGLVLTIIAIEACQAGVVSFSSIATETIGGVQTKKTTVTCRNSSYAPVLIKANKNSQWCDTKLDGFCGTDRMAAAKRVCSKEYSQTYKANARLSAKASVAEQGISEDDRAKAISALHAERLQIEQALITIQEARLSLRRRELELLNKQKKLD